MTPREYILGNLRRAVTNGKRRESRRLDSMHEYPHGLPRKKRDGTIVLRKHPPQRPIGATPAQILGDSDKKRPFRLDVLEPELSALRKEGVLGFTSGVWWEQ